MIRNSYYFYGETPMSRITSSECFCRDMEWYGIDKKGNIAVFCSAGEGYLPEFVCENEERADELMEYFDTLKKSTNSMLFFESIERAEQVAREFSDKGLYYFDSDDGTRFGISTLHEYYTKLSAPQEPLKYELLPNRIKELLKFNLMEIADFSTVNTIYVKHAYE